MISVTDKYINSLYELTQIEFPEHVILQAKKCLLDYIGVTFAGAIIMKEKGDAFLNNSEKGDVSIIGFDRKSNLYNAALINGMSSHIAELDDGIRQGNFHPGSPIISALLPIVQHYKLTGKDLLKGMIVGYEAAIRLACAMQPSHRNKGYHATGTCGTIGVALGVGAALGFSKEQMKSTLSAATTNSSGMLNVSDLKPFNAGQACVSGIMAALIAKTGFDGASEALTGKWGFIDMMTDKRDLSLLDSRFEGKFGIERVYIKPYAACRHCHPAIEAAIMLKQNTEIIPEQIKEVVVSTYRLAANGHEHTDINSITDAKLSVPYSVAVALMTGKAGIEEYSEEFIEKEEIKNLTKKVKVFADDALNAFVPQKRPALVTVTTDKQDKYSFQIDLAKGEPENPLTIDEITEKFNSLTVYSGRTISECSKLKNFIWNIEDELSVFLNSI